MACVYMFVGGTWWCVIHFLCVFINTFSQVDNCNSNVHTFKTDACPSFQKDKSLPVENCYVENSIYYPSADWWMGKQIKPESKLFSPKMFIVLLNKYLDSWYCYYGCDLVVDVCVVTKQSCSYNLYICKHPLRLIWERLISCNRQSTYVLISPKPNFPPIYWWSTQPVIFCIKYNSMV